MTEQERSRSRPRGDVHKDENKALEIIYATPDPKDDMSDVGKRDLPSELRERYWIEQAKNVGISGSWVNVGVIIPWEIERQELGRSRNEPGDGFRYVVRAGTSGVGGRAEWFEVTEVFEGVKARDIEAFMRIRNNIATRQALDLGAFLNGLDHGTPGRAAQRRAADSVIHAVGKKLAKDSYRDMSKVHGFGTLIVGLPLWFASYAANPYRAENVIDDFVTRVSIGLQPHFRRLRSRKCPFWRIVVIWKPTGQSMREWTYRARLDQYDDPAFWNFSGMPAIAGSLMASLVDLTPEGMTLHIDAARPEKLEKRVQLPRRMAPLLQIVENLAMRHRVPLYQRIKLRILKRCLELACFLRVHGLEGLERWLVARLLPRNWMARLARRRRAEGFYRASRLPADARRQARIRRRSGLSGN